MLADRKDIFSLCDSLVYIDESESDVILEKNESRLLGRDGLDIISNDFKTPLKDEDKFSSGDQRNLTSFKSDLTATLRSTDVERNVALRSDLNKTEERSASPVPQLPESDDKVSSSSSSAASQDIPEWFPICLDGRYTPANIAEVVTSQQVLAQPKKLSAISDFFQGIRRIFVRKNSPQDLS